MQVETGQRELLLFETFFYISPSRVIEELALLKIRTSASREMSLLVGPYFYYFRLTHSRLTSALETMTAQGLVTRVESVSNRLGFSSVEFSVRLSPIISIKIKFFSSDPNRSCSYNRCAECLVNRDCAAFGERVSTQLGKYFEFTFYISAMFPKQVSPTTEE